MLLWAVKLHTPIKLFWDCKLLQYLLKHTFQTVTSLMFTQSLTLDTNVLLNWDLKQILTGKKTHFDQKGALYDNN